MTDLVAYFTVLSGQVILELVIFGVGLLLAKLVSKAILSTAPAQSSPLAMTHGSGVLLPWLWFLVLVGVKLRPKN